MRKLICFVSLLIVCCLLCACDPSITHVRFDPLDKVVGVELILYYNPDQKTFRSWVPDHFDKLLPFDVDKAMVLEVLPEENLPDFLETLSGADILHTYYAFNSPKDICLRLRYENGDFMIVWANYAQGSFAGYIGEYSADGKVLSFVGSFVSLRSYEELVNRYFAFDLTKGLNGIPIELRRGAAPSFEKGAPMA